VNYHEKLSHKELKQKSLASNPNQKNCYGAEKTRFLLKKETRSWLWNAVAEGSANFFERESVFDIK